MEEKTEFTIVTRDDKEMRLYLNAYKLVYALYDVVERKSAIYNGRDTNYHVLFKGRLYDYNEWNSGESEWRKYADEDDFDEYGILKEGKVKYVYLEEDVLNMLDDFTENIVDVVDDYMQ